MDQTDKTRAETFVRDYADLATRIGYTWLGNLYDAQDICQAVLLKLLLADNLPEPVEERRRYVVRMAINECKNLKNSAWFRRTAPLTDGLMLAAEAPDGEDGALLAAVQSLPPKYREVIFLHYYEGYAVAEIGTLLGHSPALVSTHLARARAKLKTLLGGECYGREPI